MRGPWSQNDGKLQSVAIVTTDADAVVEPTYDRMPVILEPDAERRLLDAERCLLDAERR